MERVAVHSRDIAIVGYDADKKTLEVAFRAGGVYRFSDVPSDIYQAFMTSDSYGRFFQQHIRGQFPYSKIHLN